MNTLETRFGEVDYDPENLLTFPAGIIGFPDLRKFIVMPNKKKGPLFWIQSVEDPQIAFVLTDPTNFFLDYSVAPDEAEKKHLHIKQEESWFILSVVTVPSHHEITVNLAAPIIFAPSSNRAIQVILENSKYSTKTPLPKINQDN